MTSIIGARPVMVGGRINEIVEVLLKSDRTLGGAS